MPIFKNTGLGLIQLGAGFAVIVLLWMSPPLLAGGCDFAAIPESTPDVRFSILTETVIAGGFPPSFLQQPRIVVDTLTGLQWTYCSLGQTGNSLSPPGCNGTAVSYTWSGALAVAEDHTVTVGDIGNQTIYSNWRLPNIKELASIVELCNVSPAINLDIFPATLGEPYWSSSPIAGSNSVHIIQFFAGQDFSDTKASDFFVRLVRNGQ